MLVPPFDEGGIKGGSGVHPLRETVEMSIKVDISNEEMSYVSITQAIHS